MVNECYNKCKEYISKGIYVIPCEEFTYDTCIDTVMMLKSEGINCRCLWGDVVLCIRIYTEEDI